MLILKMNYTKTLEQAAKSVRYHAFRSREVTDEKRGMFGRDTDHADVKAFVRSLDDPITRDRPTRNGGLFQPAKLHRLMFSLSRREFEACGFKSWKPVIREALGAFERYHGIKLEWVAAEHQSAGHPHVHVDIKSVYTAPDGTKHRLRITNEMRLHLRWAVEGIMKRERSIVDEERRQERALNRAVHDLTHTLLRGLRDAAREEWLEPGALVARPKKRPRRQPEPEDHGR